MPSEFKINGIDSLFNFLNWRKLETLLFFIFENFCIIVLVLMFENIVHIFVFVAADAS